MKKIILTFIVLIGLSPINVPAKNLGNIGMTYPIKERDAQEEIEERAKSVDWNKHLAKVKPENYRPSNVVILPRAAKDTSFMVDMTYSLEMEIPDGKGGVLYPKGFTYNPLDFISYHKTLVVIDATDQDQVQWFNTSEYSHRKDVTLLITGGNYLEAGKKTDRPVFYATELIRDRFKLQAVPSVIRQKFRMMEVKEVAVRHQSFTGGHR